VRQTASRAIVQGWRDRADTLPRLREWAERTEHPYVRSVAIRALVAGWREDPATLPLLRGLMVHDPDGEVRELIKRLLRDRGMRDSQDVQ
jgi:HEAT repeats